MTNLRSTLAGSLIAFSGFSSLALGIRLADQDPMATARGNAFAATADNPSAIYYNPAGITQLEGHNLRLGIYSIYLNSSFETPAGARTETIDKIQAAPQFYYTFSSAECPVSLGLGVYSPYGLALDWPDSAPFRTLGRKGKLIYSTVNPVIAWKICPAVSIAAGPTFNYGDLELRRGIFVRGDDFRFRGDDTDVGFNAGVRWQIAPEHAVGLSYRKSTSLNFEGHADTHLIFPFAFNGTENASAQFHFPQNVVFGYSFRPTPEWNFEVNVDWTDWDSLNTVLLKKPSGNVPLVFNWTSSFFYEFGATRQFHNGYSASAGYIYSENSVPDATFNPVVPDSDRHIFSLGVGRKYKNCDWEAAYQFAYGPSRTINNGTAANGNYTFTSHAITISFGYHF
jgi:long-chain fatty acid transport protein